MCGIIGILGEEAAAPRVIEALRRLEYRGYDSAGIAALEADGLERRRAPGKLKALENVLVDAPLSGRVAIGHTRWATHGAPNETNAHPHQAGKVAVVHNGIIENFRELREEMEAAGRSFVTETDSETIAHLIDNHLQDGDSPKDAVFKAMARLRGAFAIAVLFEGETDLMIGARKGSPLVVGVGEGEMFLGSDALAVAPFTNKVIYLDEGEWCVLSRKGVDVYSADGEAASYAVQIVQGVGAAAEKGNYRHFMQKEIFEQPDSTSRTIGAYVDAVENTIRLPQVEDVAPLDFSDFDRIVIVACGTAYYAGCVAEYWFEKYAKIPVETDIASEFRYREPALGPRDLAMFISQSGETADTLAALRYCKDNGLTTAAVVNVPTSTIAREADIVLPTLAGPEIGVASTKAFTAQLCTLAAVSVAAAVHRKQVDAATEAGLVHELLELPRLISEALQMESDISRLAGEMHEARDVLYLGRGAFYPIALEGALKLKEISYIHAEGYASGELKHGPIALIDEHTPVVMIAPNDVLYEKSLSNLQEVAARRGRVVLISDAKGAELAADAPWTSLTAPACGALIAPILYTIPVQLLAYHIAVEKGTDVDQPRNLAKSVTVE